MARQGCRERVGKFMALLWTILSCSCRFMGEYAIISLLAVINDSHFGKAPVIKDESIIFNNSFHCLRVCRLGGISVSECDETF